ncbi:MAG TPA: hypothetical protein PKD50_25045, partial [Leptospiraceae bacterium]|nr:hypothetical protein [Leptospiraceae bacterium]
MKYILYDTNGFEELGSELEALGKMEMFNRENPNQKKSFIACESFPPTGKVFEKGSLRDKTEKEKVQSGELNLDKIKDSICEQINKTCYAAIISGFESSALGDIYIYDSEETDQTNLIGAVAVGGSVQYKCTRKSDGKKDFVLHTNTQIKKVLGDAATR